MLSRRMADVSVPVGFDNEIGRYLMDAAEPLAQRHAGSRVEFHHFALQALHLSVRKFHAALYAVPALMDKVVELRLQKLL